MTQTGQLPFLFQHGGSTVTVQSSAVKKRGENSSNRSTSVWSVCSSSVSVILYTHTHRYVVRQKGRESVCVCVCVGVGGWVAVVGVGSRQFDVTPVSWNRGQAGKRECKTGK